MRTPVELVDAFRAGGRGPLRIAEWFETLARAEKSHVGRFQQGLEAL